MTASIGRKGFLLGAAATAFAIHPARAARKAVIRLGTDLAADHPVVIHLTIAAGKIKAATAGEVELSVFPNNQLGDDTHMLANLRSGAMQMMAIGDNILATLVPNAAIDNIGFAFKSADDAWKACDGAVGDVVRDGITKSGLAPMHRIWDQGFRQITTGAKPINTPDDLRGLKMRVPPSPISLSLFQSLGASPVTINSAEIYTALQTHVADAQENPLAVIETNKFYQVQKYISLTSHMWVGFWPVANGAFWNGLPAEHRDAVAKALDAQALEQRVANQKLDGTLEEMLKGQGITFVQPDRDAFRAVLTKAGFYSTWREKFGPALWSALETYTGPLA